MINGIGKLVTRGFTSNVIIEFAFRLCSFRIKMIKENQRDNKTLKLITFLFEVKFFGSFFNEFLPSRYVLQLFPVVGKKCNPNPNRKLTEMSRTRNLLLLISSLILRCFAKTFSFIVYFYILETHRL